MSWPRVSDRPDAIRQEEDHARKLAWITIGFMVSIIVAIYMTMGSSQAMKAAWLEDLLSLVPPVSFLIASKVARKGPDDSFPWGYERATAIAFLVGSTALLAMGVFMIYDSGMKLIQQHHPTMGHHELFGVRLWSGWWMIMALAYSAVPPVILGRMKTKAAKKLSNKALLADAKMNRADWMTAGAGIVGVLGIGMGLWWADAVAALFISVDVVKDGYGNTRQAVFDLMDERPTDVEGRHYLGLEEVAAKEVSEFEWVDSVRVRMRNAGEVVMGEVWVRSRDGILTRANVREVEQRVCDLDWRIQDAVVCLDREDRA